MNAAIAAVKNGGSVLRAAKEHGVPRQTLQDRISGRVVHGTKPGPKPYLTSVEEKELSDFLVDVSKRDMAKLESKSRGLWNLWFVTKE